MLLKYTGSVSRLVYVRMYNSNVIVVSGVINSYIGRPQLGCNVGENDKSQTDMDQMDPNVPASTVKRSYKDVLTGGMETMNADGP